MSEFVLDFFEGKNLATIEKKKHSYLMIPELFMTR